MAQRVNKSDNSSEKEDYNSKRSNSSESQDNNSKSSVNDRKSNSDQGSRKIFPMEIFLNEEQIEMISSSKLLNIFDNIIEQTGVQDMKFDPSFNFQDLNGKLVKIVDNSILNKSKACEAILKETHNHLNDSSSTFRRDGKEFPIMILIPDNLVSLLIGRQGIQIKKIMADSNTTMVVNQPLKGSLQRTVTIKGKYQNIAKACYYVTDLIESKSNASNDVDKPVQSSSLKNVIVKGKFIFSKKLTDYLMEKHKQIIRNLEEKLNTTIKFAQDRHLNFLSKDEYICIIKGKLEPVQSTIVYLLRQINQYYTQERDKPDYLVRLLIPNNYVTKLIGKSGCMIRDIAKRSGGAQIKILSDKRSEKDYDECLIQIAGTLANKQDASCLVIEKIEQFRSGGPFDDIPLKRSKKSKSKSGSNSSGPSRSRSRDKRASKYEKSPQDRRKKYDKKAKDDSSGSQYEQNVLKIPILIPQYLALSLKDNEQKLLRQIKKDTGSSLQIDKELSNDSTKLRKVVLNGTIKQNTKAFEQLQKLFLDLRKE